MRYRVLAAVLLLATGTLVAAEPSQRTLPPDLDPQSAPAFKSYRELTAAFDRQERDVERLRLSPSDYLTKMLALEEQRVLAIHRYLADHSKAHDRADAAWNAIEARIWPRYVQRLSDRWGEFGAQIIEEIDQFLRGYPESPHCAQAAIDRAFITFGVRPEGGTKDRPWRNADILALDLSLADLAREHAGTTLGGLALAWRLILAANSATTAGIPEIRTMKEQLDKQYGQDREVQAAMWDYRGAVEVLTSGIDDFDGTDLGGTHWTASAFKGKVTLIDFWATWCGPCVAEITTIRKAWTAYHDEGLAILGVSLDPGDRARFETWLATNDVRWPQIWDGKVYSTPLAKRYAVHGIPFTVLVDRNGRVTNVNMSGDALLARIRTLLEAPTDPASGDTSSGR
jgi:thiol-disulfide isomerase/thioredoxin